jgi:hypothetical protein
VDRRLDSWQKRTVALPRLLHRNFLCVRENF